MFSRSISSERQGNLVIDRKRSASAGASSQNTRSSKNGKFIKTGATKPRGGSCEQRLLSRKENKKARDDAKHKGRLYDDACVVSEDNNDPIYILRKEIHDWRMSGQLANGFERATEDETEKSFVQEKYSQVITKDLQDDLPELPSTIIERSTQCTENSSTLESCKDSSVTSSRKMTSVCTCYCKQEENLSHKKDDDITNRNQHPISKKMIIKNKDCKNNREFPRRERSSEKTSKNRSVEVQSNSILSPETSTALENAEKIINNAKIQLMEVCTMSNLDSSRQNRNIYLNPPLDDETEELLYIRELVASKFYETNTSRSEANNGGTKAHLEDRESPRVTVRRVDLSAPKFQMSRRRRRADCRSLEYGSYDRSLDRVSPAEASSTRNDSSSSKDSNDEEKNEATTSNDRARNLSERTEHDELNVRARENACEIQIGPSMNIVDRELRRQDLEDVHISPESSWCRANTATYILRHFDAAENPVTFADNEPRKIPETPRKTLRVRLDTFSRGEEPIVAEVVTEATTVTTNVSENDVGDIKDSEQDNGQIEFLASRVQNCIESGEEKNKIDTKDTKISECLENATNQETINPVVIENSEIDNDEKLQDKSKNKNKGKITFRDDIDYAKEGRLFNKNIDVDEHAYLQNEEDTVDEVQENPNDRSKPPPDNDTPKKTGFSHRENIVSQTYRRMESSRLYQTQIDERFTNTFDSHNGQNDKDVHHRSFVSNCTDDFRMKDNLNEIDLYQPCLNDLDTILLSNDRKIERIVRANENFTENFTELLSRFEFATYRDENKQTLRYVSNEEFHLESSDDKDRKIVLNEPTRSLTFETELKDAEGTEGLIVSCVSSEICKTNTNSEGTFTDTIEMKSSIFTKESDSRSKYSKNFVESNVFPASDTSYRSEIFGDKIQRPSSKAHLSESIDKSDVTTFSNIIPALSSTRTDIQTYAEKRITQNDCHADADQRRVMSVNRSSKREFDHSQKKYFDNVFAQTSRKDASETADRFIAYLLQDEKQSIERKITDALKESAISPVAVQKLLDNLRNVEPMIRNARETETLDILKNILINIQNQIDRETKENVLFATRSEFIQHSENKRDKRQTENVDIVKIDTNKNQIHEGVEETVETFLENVVVVDTTIPTNAIEESILQTQIKKNNANDIGQIVKKSYDFNKSVKLFSDSFACRETREASLRSTAFLESVQSSENNSEGNSYSEAESLKQISDIRSDDDTLPRKSSQNPSVRIVSANFNEGCTMKIDDSIQAISAENKKDDGNNERHESNDAQETQEAEIKEIIIEETHDNIVDEFTSANQNVSPAKVSKIENERIHSDANSVKSVSEILEKENVSLAHSSAKKDIESEKNIDSQHSLIKEKIGFVANSCSVDSLRDHPSLSSIKNNELSLEEVTSQSVIAGKIDLIKDTKDNETHDKSMTIIATDDNRRDGTEDSGFLKNTKNNNKEQLNDLQKYKIDILSSSNSSVNSTLLDCDNRSINDAFDENVKRIETSSETSHSEGELYMPSSCSYSLGEVRILKKCELISDNSIDHDNSTTILVTRSMITSLNDSPMSLLGSSGFI